MSTKNASNPLLTIFTPTFNRAHILGRTYKSLCEQKSKNFVWMIIDDGSKDNTKDLVDSWKKNDNGFEIIYFYKENGGMHTAHNVAYENITTELNVCIDSDDLLAENAVEIIEKTWNMCKDYNYAGIIGLDADFNGNIIGLGFTEPQTAIKIGDYYRNGGRGDKKLVYRTDIMKQLPPYPVFEGENFVSLGYKYLLCDEKYDLFCINEILSNVEYQEDGSSKNIIAQIYNNPKGYAFVRKYKLQTNLSTKRLFMETIHYVSSSIISRNKHFISESPKRILTILMIPFGIGLTLYMKNKLRKKH